MWWADSSAAVACPLNDTAQFPLARILASTSTPPPRQQPEMTRGP